MRWVWASLAVSGCWTEQLIDDSFSEPEWEFLQSFRLELLAPPPCPDEVPSPCDAHAQLGKRLFFDPRFSGPIHVANDGNNGGPGTIGVVSETGKVSCATCHDPEHWFVDVRSPPNQSNPVSLGAGWTSRNTPSLVDVAYQRSFAWRGDKTRLADAVLLALRDAAMNTTPNEIVSWLFKTTATDRVQYRTHYDRTFDPDLPLAPRSALEVDQIFQRLANAIAAYESKLVSGPAPFDRYLAGEYYAVDESAKRGAQLFIGKALCSECHSGPLFTDHQFHVIGVEQVGIHAPPTDRGRFEVPGQGFPYNEGRFRTPSLRNVAETAPYMHAGQLATLGEVVEHYRWGGAVTGFSGAKDPRIQALELDDDDVVDLVAFLDTLTGSPVDVAWTSPPRQAVAAPSAARSAESP